MILPRQRKTPLFLKPLLLLPALLLSGCSTDGFRLFHPVGLLGGAELHYTLLIVGVMLIVILPTLVMTVLFPLRYHKSRNAKYRPDWTHSTVVEIVAWGVPLVIVGFLSYFSIQAIYVVNPYGPTALDNAPGAALAPLEVDVISTDWQWFFVYPAQHIATIDDLVVPAGQRVEFQMTSTSVMNGFYIPQIAPMIDVMPGMRTKDAFEVDQPGTFEGFSTDFSGAGFSWMQFSTRVVAPADFAAWVKATQASPNQLTYAAFQTLAQPTVNVGAKPAYFSAPDQGLFMDVYNAAQQGVVYPVPDSLTKSVSEVSAEGTQAPAGQ
jgi:cytochrome o ubiquinol oxidase subunit 2